MYHTALKHGPHCSNRNYSESVRNGVYILLQAEINFRQVNTVRCLWHSYTSNPMFGVCCYLKPVFQN